MTTTHATATEPMYGPKRPRLNGPGSNRRLLIMRMRIGMASVQQHTVFNQKGINKFFHYGQVCLTIFPKFFNHRHLPLRGASESVLCLGKGKAQEMTKREF